MDNFFNKPWAAKGFCVQSAIAAFTILLESGTSLLIVPSLISEMAFDISGLTIPRSPRADASESCDMERRRAPRAVLDRRRWFIWEAESVCSLRKVPT